MKFTERILTKTPFMDLKWWEKICAYFCGAAAWALKTLSQSKGVDKTCLFLEGVATWIIAGFLIPPVVIFMYLVGLIVVGIRIIKFYWKRWKDHSESVRILKLLNLPSEDHSQQTPIIKADKAVGELTSTIHLI